MKKHEFEYAARQFRAGKLRLDDFTEKLFPPVNEDADKRATSMEEIDALLDQLRDRNADSHKGDYGRVLIIAGSPGMSGAAALAGMAALRTGSGTVTVATMGVSQQVAGFHPAVMTRELGDLVTSFGELCEHFDSPDTLPFDVVGIGPGLGVSRSTKHLVNSLVKKCPVPVVVDADAINNLGSDFEWSQMAGSRVLTPHPGELKRLMPEPADSRQQQAEFAASIVEANSACVVALKGSGTLVIDSGGTTKNDSGNPGMATAGSGDVLTGMIVALLGQGLNCSQATRLGCYLHGKAGDVAAKIYSQPAMVATDIIGCIPKAFAKKKKVKKRNEFRSVQQSK